MLWLGFESGGVLLLLLFSIEAIALLSLLFTIEFLVLVWPASAVIPLSPECEIVRSLKT